MESAKKKCTEKWVSRSFCIHGPAGRRVGGGQPESLDIGFFAVQFDDDIFGLDPGLASGAGSYRC
jgi:hypothetical protein